MNIFLVPYTWVRHVAVGLVVGGASLLAWWFVLHLVAWVGPVLWEYGLFWGVSGDGLVYLSVVSGSIAFTSMFAEHSLRRSPLWQRLAYGAVAGGIALIFTAITFLIIGLIVQLTAREAYATVVRDPSLTSLRHHLCQWLSAGVGSGLGPAVARRGRGIVTHLLGGLGAAGAGGAVWHYFGYNLVGDLYLGAALGAFTWGTLHGLLVWGIPAELYAGWVRVLSAYRYGYRIPVDHIDGSPSERFVGHFPRGLDLFLPVEEGVAELHTSFVVDRDHHYAIRGLSVSPTLIKRFLERVDLRWDPKRPAPLETSLNMEDRILLSDGRVETEVEFIMLPKEER